MTLGRFLRDRRSGSCLSQAKLAERCRVLAPNVAGFTPASINFWEHDLRQPSLAQADVLAEAFGLTVEERARMARLARAEALIAA